MSDTYEIKLPDTTPEFMAPAYFGCLHWAVGNLDILKQFCEESGVPIPKLRTDIERMVDAACGFDMNKDFVQKFVPWFNERIWGEM